VKTVIMLVDDDALFLEELSEILRSGDYETVEVRDPRKAVEMAQRVRPDLILLDLKMPGQSGFEVAFDLKDEPALAFIPIIAMSGLPDQKHSVYLELSQVRKFLAKPFNPLDLIWAVEDALNQEQSVLV